MELALRDIGLDNSIISAIHDMLDFIDDTEKPHHPSRAYIRDTKAMKETPADIIEYPNSYRFVVDMPGLKTDQISVHLEDGNVLVVSGERKRDQKGKTHDKDEGVKFLRMERRVGKLLKKFILPENTNADNISAVYQDGVLTVIVEKKPPPEPKELKVIEVKVGQQGEGSREVKTERSSEDTTGIAGTKDGTAKTD